MIASFLECLKQDARSSCQEQSFWPRLLLMVWGVFVCAKVFQKEDFWWNPFRILDLGAHEIGHWLTLFLGSGISVPAGTIAQLILPSLALWQFLKQRDHFAASFVLSWFATNLLNISLYARDAAQGITHDVRLSMFGAEFIHDWIFMLSHTGLLSHSVLISNFIWLLACACALAFILLGSPMLWWMFSKKS